MPALRTRDTQSRPLEVTTDAPQPPTLTIISPTPRAFTFPIPHNLSPNSPYSTPSNSPFEPDLNSLAISSSSSCTTPPPLMRTLSPSSSFTSVSPSPTTNTNNSHLRSDVERRPKKGDEDYIKRPENAFILFRRKCCEERQAAEDDSLAGGLTKKQRQADLSKTISQQWKSLTPEERKYWEELAKEKKKEHAQMYPGYVYRPQRVRDKDGKARNKKRKGSKVEANMTESSPPMDSESMSFVIAPPRQHGRSASAPTPPPAMSYQSIQFPRLYSPSPSCPASPSLLPMISRRVMHNGKPEDVMSNFDFMPNSEHFVAPAFGHEQSNLHSSEFLRNMFNMTSNEAPLTITTDTSLLLPAHQIVSPASSMGTNSSGPSSPATGPFTPTHPTSPHSAFDFSGVPNSACLSDAQMQAELEMQMQMTPTFDFSEYSWPMSSVWQDQSNLEMLHNDFDLNSIPLLEIGGPKYIEQTSNYVASPEAMGMGDYAQEYQQEYSNEYIADYQQEYVPSEHNQYFESQQSTESSLLGFDNMMASPAEQSL